MPIAAQCMGRSRRRDLTALLLAALVFAPGASAQPTNDDNPFRVHPSIFVYHSRDGDGFWDFTTQLPIGPHVLPIRATAGALSSLVPPLCIPSTPLGGNEICALDVEFQLSGEGRLLSFTPAPPYLAGTASFVNSAGTRLQVNLTSGSAPLAAGFPPPVIGDLELEVTGGLVSVSVAGVMGIGPSSVDSQPVFPHIEFIPEPNGILLLGSCIGMLALLHRWKRMRAG